MYVAVITDLILNSNTIYTVAVHRSLINNNYYQHITILGWCSDTIVVNNWQIFNLVFAPVVFQRKWAAL